MYIESVRCYVFYTFINFIDINWNRKLNLICAYNVPETILGTFRYVNLWSLQQNLWSTYYYGYRNRESE